MNKINSEIVKITGRPCEVGKGNSNNSTASNMTGDLGMGKFSPRKGANRDGKYICDGVEAYGSGGKSSGGTSGGVGVR